MQGIQHEKPPDQGGCGLVAGQTGGQCPHAPSTKQRAHPLLTLPDPPWPVSLPTSRPPPQPWPGRYRNRCRPAPGHSIEHLNRMAPVPRSTKAVAESLPTSSGGTPSPPATGTGKGLQARPTRPHTVRPAFAGESKTATALPEFRKRPRQLPGIFVVSACRIALDNAGFGEGITGAQGRASAMLHGQATHPKFFVYIENTLLLQKRSGQVEGITGTAVCCVTIHIQRERHLN